MIATHPATSETQKLNVAKVTIHPEFDGLRQTNDLAILHVIIGLFSWKFRYFFAEIFAETRFLGYYS